MARQLLENRSPAAYAGVEAFARQHAHDDAGVLANLALGYAHVLDHEPAKAIAPLKLTQARAGDLADYTAYFLGASYQATGQNELAIATLRDFATKYPDSIFVRDAAASYANALVASGDPAQAVALLEKYRRPYRSDLEFALRSRAASRRRHGARHGRAASHVFFHAAWPPRLTMPARCWLPRAGWARPTRCRKRAPTSSRRRRRYREAVQEFRSLRDLATPGGASGGGDRLGGRAAPQWRRSSGAADAGRLSRFRRAT